jgi:hypothetical protein
MKNKKIVFILGAGASMPFQQPSGFELVKLVDESLKFEPKKIYKTTRGGFSSLVPDFDYDDTRSENVLVQLIMDAGFEKTYIEHFRKSLVNSQINSVDAFLEHRTEFISIGKMAIAYNLLKREQFSQSVFNTNPDWYKYLWNKLITKFEDFPKNDIALITFNYDRTLEHFLFNSFKSLYGKNDQISATEINKIKIIHLHGSLGFLPWQADTENEVSFGYEIQDFEELINISNNIKIIHEDVSNNAAFIDAHTLLSVCDEIYFLGFGFNEINLDRLKIKTLERTILGTSLGLSDNERYQIQNANPNIILEGYGHLNCFQFLKEHVSFN